MSSMQCTVHTNKKEKVAKAKNVQASFIFGSSISVKHKKLYQKMEKTARVSLKQI